MNRAGYVWYIGFLYHLPHTRGDEPGSTVAGARKIENLPHTRGDEPGGASSDDIREWICPTRVGMNRDFIYCDTDSVKNLPHTRGDEPRRGAHIYLGINDLPHTRGDEPRSASKY